MENQSTSTQTHASLCRRRSFFASLRLQLWAILATVLNQCILYRGQQIAVQLEESTQSHNGDIWQPPMEQRDEFADGHFSYLLPFSNDAKTLTKQPLCELCNWHMSPFLLQTWAAPSQVEVGDARQSFLTSSRWTWRG